MTDCKEVFQQVMGETIGKYTNYANVTGSTLYVSVNLQCVSEQLETKKGLVKMAMNDFFGKEQIARVVIVMKRI